MFLRVLLIIREGKRDCGMWNIKFDEKRISSQMVYAYITCENGTDGVLQNIST